MPSKHMAQPLATHPTAGDPNGFFQRSHNPGVFQSGAKSFGGGLEPLCTRERVGTCSKLLGRDGAMPKEQGGIAIGNLLSSVARVLCGPCMARVVPTPPRSARRDQDHVHIMSSYLESLKTRPRHTSQIACTATPDPLVEYSVRLHRRFQQRFNLS